MFSVKEMNTYNKDTPDSLIDQFQQAFDQISDKHTSLLGKYDMLLD